MRLFLLWLPLIFATQAAPDRCLSLCLALGECTPAQGGRCIAAMDEDCLRGKVCAQNGRCTARIGSCFATTEEDCRTSTDCVDEGRCTVNDGYCEALSDVDCRASTGCEQEGACGLNDGECVPLGQSDCEESSACTEHGRCAFQGGVCMTKSTPTADPTDPSEHPTEAPIKEGPPPPIQADGPLRRRGLRSTLREARNGLARCGELTADVELRATIDPKGKPRDIVVLGVPSKMESCIAKSFKRLRFAEKKRETKLIWRLHKSL